MLWGKGDRLANAGHFVDTRYRRKIVRTIWQRGSLTAPLDSQPDTSERGSAAVEFVFLVTILLIPVIYLILVLGQMQAGAYAVVEIADQTAKILASSPDSIEARARAEQTMVLAAADYGFSTQQASLQVSCSAPDCVSAGSYLSVTISLQVPLPLVPMLPGVNTTAATVQAQATQLVSVYR